MEPGSNPLLEVFLWGRKKWSTMSLAVTGIGRGVEDDEPVKINKKSLPDYKIVHCSKLKAVVDDK